MAKRKLIIYGNGQMARMFYSFAYESFDVVAFTVDRHVIDASEIEHTPVVPFDEIQSAFPPENHNMISAAGFLEMNRLRARKYSEGRQKGYTFVNYIHPSVVLHKTLSFGVNNIILDHVSIHPFCSLGDCNFICSGVSIGHGCRLLDNCWVNSGVSIGGETAIGKGCFLGINATIGDNISIGESCYIGANTLIARSTNDSEVYISSNGELFPATSSDFLRFIARNNPQS